MKFKNKTVVKVAALSLVAAFSFGLTVSCLSNKISPVATKASLSDGDFEVVSGKLYFTYYAGDPTVSSVDQTGVYGNADSTGQFTIGVSIKGSWGDEGTIEQLDEGDITFVNAYYVEKDYASTGFYGTIVGYPQDVAGLYSEDQYTIDIEVEPTGTLNPKYTEGWNYDEANSTFILIDDVEIQETSLAYVEDHSKTNGTIDLVYSYSGGFQTFTATDAQYFAEENLVTGVFDGLGFREINIEGAQYQADEVIEYVDGWNYNPTDSRLYWQQPDVNDPDTENTNPTKVIFDDESAIIIVTHNGNHDYDPHERVILNNIQYNPDSQLINGTLGDIQVYDVVSKTYLSYGATVTIYIYEVTPTVAVKSISFEPESVVVGQGKGAAVRPVIYPEGATGTFEWSGGDQNIAYIVDNIVTGVGVGTTTFTYTDIDTNVSAELTVTVAEHCEEIRLAHGDELVTSLDMISGEELTLDIIPYPDGSVYDCTWTSSDTSVVEVDQSGHVIAVGAGSATITVTDSSSTVEPVQCTVTVSGPPTEGWNYNGEDLSYYDPAYPNARLRREFAVLYESGWEVVKVRYAFVDIETDEVIDYKWVTLTSASYEEGTSGYTVTGSFSEIADQRINLSLDLGEVYIPGDGVAYYTYNNAIFPSASTALDSSGQAPLCDMVASSATYDLDTQIFTAVFNLVNPVTRVAKAITQSIELQSAVVQPWPAEGKFVLVDGYLYGDADRPATFYFESALINQSADVINELYISVDGEITDEVSILVGGLIKLDAVYAPDGAEVELSWSSNDDSIAYIGSDGYLEGTGEGTTTIIVFEANSGLEATCRVTVIADQTSPKVYFDPNGGEGEMSPMIAEEMMIYAPECTFTREGYTFDCWMAENGATYLPGQKIEGITRDVTLYAQWRANSPIQIILDETEIVVYVDDPYIVGYKILPEDTEVGLVWDVEDRDIADVVEDGMLIGLSVGQTTVTVHDENETAFATFTVYVVDRPQPVQPENPIKEETIQEINQAMDAVELSGDQINRINDTITENQDYLSDEAGTIISQAILNTNVSSTDPEVAEAQKELIVTVVETGVQVDAGKATSISDAQEIDKALPDNANFSVEGEIEEFYQRQMVELFGGEMPSRRLTRAVAPTHSIDTDTQGKEGQEAVDYLANEQSLYQNMVDFVDTGVDHMGKAALKLRKCSGESVTVQVKSYVTVVKVSSFREFDKEAADKEFVEAVYKAILLSMQNEVISILEKEHKPSGNIEKEAQYKKELEAVQDIETFEIMVTEVLRQKYVALTGEQIDDVEDFMPIYWEIFTAWALDKPSPYAITLEELTQTTIEQSTGRAKAFTVNSKLTATEWGFIAGVAGGAALIITASAVIPSVLKKKRAKEGNE